MIYKDESGVLHYLSKLAKFFKYIVMMHAVCW